MFMRHSFILSCLVLGGACFLGGCATRDSGYKISKETIAFIKPGVTTKAELIENLGTPLLDLKDVRALAYSWGKMRATATTPVVREQGLQSQQMGYSMGAPPLSDEGGLIETRRWVCCVALDENERVRRVETVEVSGAQSLEEAVRRWVAALGK